MNITDKLYYNGTEISLDNIINNSTSTSTSTSISSVLPLSVPSMTLTNSINIGGQINSIINTNYNSEIVNIYKYKDNQKTKFEIYLHDSTITPYGSSAYIGHFPLNTLYNEIDNSLIVLTEFNSTWNNIYFYAGKNKSTINNTPPNLAIFEYNKIGINTLRAEKTLDINGDIISSNYYIRTTDNIIFECGMMKIYNNTNNINKLDINITENTNITNLYSLNVKGGINSFDGYYDNNNKLCTIIYINTNNAIIENTNLGLGVQIINPNITIPLQIQNTNNNNNKINNSVITFYRSTDNSKYSGIEFSDDATNINIVNKNKWYIYKNHITDDLNYVGPLQFGFMNNSYKPTSSCINLYYDNNKYYIDINNPRTYNSADEFNKNKENLRITGNVRITGDIDIDGSINIKGNYKFNDNNILFSPNPVETIINKIYSLGNNVYYFDTILSSNHPKNISFRNKNVSTDIYTNILDDTNNFNYPLNLNNSQSNLTIATTNYIIGSNISNLMYDYYNKIIINTNHNNNFIQTINQFSEILDTNLNTNITNKTNNITINNNTLKLFALSNVSFAFSNYTYSSNYFSNIYNTRLLTYNTYLTLLNQENILRDFIPITSSYSNLINTSYASINYNTDINIILKYTTSNTFLSSILFNNNINYKNNMNSMSEYYITTNNYYDSIKSLNFINSIEYQSIINSNYYYSYNNSNNLNTIDIISKLNNYTTISNMINPITNEIQLLFNDLQNTNNLTSKIYNSISKTDKSYKNDASNNSNIAISNYNHNINISNYNNSYSNILLDIINNNNIITNYNTIIPTHSNIINVNNNLNIDYYINNNTTPYNSANIYYNASNNSNLSYRNYQIALNIYEILSNIDKIMIDYKIIAFNNYIYTSNYNKIIETNYINLQNIYTNINYVIDISNILKTGYSNHLIASNIYTTSSNFYNNIITIQNLTSYSSNLSFIDMTSCFTTYTNCSNIYNIPILNAPLNTIILNNKLNGTIILDNIENIYYNFINTYPILYTSFVSSMIEHLPSINNDILLTTANKTATSKIILAIDKNISEYISSSLNNSNIANNIDNELSKYDVAYNEPLKYYSNNSEIGGGITTIITFINDELLVIYTNYLTTMINNLRDYNYIFDLDENLRDSYNKILNTNNFCINLLTELLTDATNLNIIDNITNNYDYQILLENVMHITNKYINFINNSYTLANDTSVFASILNNYIGIYIATSLSLIPILNIIINNANTYLETAWNIVSSNIVLFASLSYSINSIIGTMPLQLQNNEIGHNTDVLIIGNTIKLYPTKSLLIGHENAYTQWLETINNITTAAAVYIYNYNINSIACSFNCKSQKFISSPGNLLTLKSSASIDLNLIDTSYNNFEESMYDGVFFKLSHIFHRDNVYSIDATRDNSLFEITRKTNATNPYFSCYTTENNNNIFNIGGGNFYDTNTNECLVENSVVHINQDTSTYLLKLTNSTINPVSLSFFHHNINHWELKITNNFSYIYNTKTVLNITSNGLAINAITNNGTVFINSFDNTSALELQNNYNSIIQPHIQLRKIIIKDNLLIEYNANGIQYSKLSQLNDTYDISTSIFEINYNLNINTINYTLHYVNMNYTNISDITPFTFNSSTNSVNLLPIIEFSDDNITVTNPNFEIVTKGPYSVGMIHDIYVNYIKPTNTTKFETILGDVSGVNLPYELLLLTIIEQGEAKQASDYETFTIDYIINAVKIRNIITYNKYASFNVSTLQITLSNYKYQLQRPKNIVARNLLKSPLPENIINITQNNNLITIDNHLDYLEIIDGKIIYDNTFTETKHKLYPIELYGNIYNIPIYFTIIDHYKIYKEAEINIEFIDKSAKLPIITQRNIYNNTHNIYSYTDDYEIYLNTKKLLNINTEGTLTTTGNVETNNIYLKGDIYNSDGISLYDNILSLINNKSTTTNFELNAKNIILNPVIESREYYKGGILINGNNLNIRDNNLFQINNFVDNDNFITLNSCTANSYIHFNTNNNNINNSIYRIGSKNDTFGIWKLPPTTIYNTNYYIDTTNNTNIMDVLTINYRPDYKNYDMNINGMISQIADNNLKTNILNIENALTKIITLQGITYTSINATKRETGLNAEDVYTILPEVVSINNAGYSNIAYGNMTGLIVEAIKQLKTEINDIKLHLNLTS